MSISYPKLFEPISIGNVKIKNRIAMAPIGLVGLRHPNGSLKQRGIDYYIERAKGGVGLIITGLFKVEEQIDVSLRFSQLVRPSLSESLGELCEALHALGTKLFVQLTAGFGRVSMPAMFDDRPVSASAVPYLSDPSITCRALETAEVGEIVAAFGEAAEIVAFSGADGIELHGHEGYILDQFTTALWNKRTDKYGGNLARRLTFPVEILKEIRKRVGDDFPVQYRFGLKHYMKGLNSSALKDEDFVEAGRDIGEGLEMARLLEEAGFNSLHVDAGCYDSWYWPHPPVYQEYGLMVDMAAKAKEVVKIPVMAVGRLDLPELAEKVIAEGKADMIALGRGLLADPYWPVKVAEGRTEDIRPCLGCHDGCMGRLATGRPLSCAVNPACGREKIYQLSQAVKRRKVLIVGGGVAGMEAARVTSIRGHEVVLYEKDKALGGHLIEASVPEFKAPVKKLLNWYINQLKNLNVKVVLGTEASEATINRESPDVVIIATGSIPMIPDLPGVDNANMVTCIDLILGKIEAGNSVVIIGGGLIGCELALWLAKAGKKVTIVEQLPELMAGGIPVPRMNQEMLEDLLNMKKVDILTGTSVQEITEEGVIVSSEDFNNRLIYADTIVLATGLKSNDELYQKLAGKVANLYVLGDCKGPRNIMGAIWDAYEVGRSV
jgi:2-enoate reductase